MNIFWLFPITSLNSCVPLHSEMPMLQRAWESYSTNFSSCVAYHRSSIATRERILKANFRKLCKFAGITKSHTTAFHLHVMERLNHTLLQILRSTIDEDPTSWPQWLPAFMAAYRMYQHALTDSDVESESPGVRILARSRSFPFERDSDSGYVSLLLGDFCWIPVTVKIFLAHCFVHVLLKEFTFSIHSSWNTQSVWRTLLQSVSETHKNKDTASLVTGVSPNMAVFGRGNSPGHPLELKKLVVSKIFYVFP